MVCRTNWRVRLRSATDNPTRYMARYIDRRWTLRRRKDHRARYAGGDQGEVTNMICVREVDADSQRTARERRGDLRDTRPAITRSASKMMTLEAMTTAIT